MKSSTSERQLYYFIEMCMFLHTHVCYGKGQLFHINGFRKPNFTFYHCFTLDAVLLPWWDFKGISS